MTPQRVYIAGPMSGHPDLNHPAFHAAAAALRARGFDAVNPVEINPPPPANYIELSQAERRKIWLANMRRDLAALTTCDAVAVIDGWMDSEGASLEVNTAIGLDMPMFRVKELLNPFPPKAPS